MDDDNDLVRRCRQAEAQLYGCRELNKSLVAENVLLREIIKQAELMFSVAATGGVAEVTRAATGLRDILGALSRPDLHIVQ